MNTLCTWIKVNITDLAEQNANLDIAIASGNRELQVEMIFAMEKTLKNMEDFIHRQGGKVT